MPLPKLVLRLESFKQFRAKVLSALRKAGFTDREIDRVERILDTAQKRNLIFMQALLTSLRLAGVPPDDLSRLREIFSSAYENKLSGRPALSREQSLLLLELLTRNRLSYKAAHRLKNDLENGDDMLAEDLTSSFREGVQPVSMLPKKKLPKPLLAEKPLREPPPRAIHFKKRRRLSA